MNTHTIISCGEFNHPQCVKEALQTLSHYKGHPLIARFMEENKLSVPEKVTDMIDKIERGIKNKHKEPRCADLLDYIDRLKMWGKQHIFLFSLKRNQRDYLKNLALPEFVEEKLKELNLGDRFDQKVCLWKAKEPVLTEVNYPDDPLGEDPWLTFMWVQTRYYDKRVGNRFETREERSVNYFKINLKNGYAQLRLQALQSRPHKRLEQEYDIYIEKIKEIIEFHRFSPVTLEPIMRKFLYRSILTITQWSIKSRTGDLRGNKATPTIIERLRLPFRNFLTHEITVFWQCKQESQGKDKLYFSMNGINNAITFTAITDKLKVDFVLEKLQAKKKEHLEFYLIRMAELKKLVKQYPDHIRIIFIIDYYMSKLKKRQIHSGNLATETGFEEKKIIDVFLKASKAFPRRFAMDEQEGHWVFTLRNLFYHGVIEKVDPEFEQKPLKKPLKIALAMSGLPIMAFIRIIFSILSETLIQNGVENIFGIPFLVFEIIAHLLILTGFYGAKRVRKLLQKVPVRHVNKAIRYLYGISSDIIINSREFNNWADGKNVD